MATCTFPERLGLPTSVASPIMVRVLTSYGCHLKRERAVLRTKSRVFTTAAMNCYKCKFFAGSLFCHICRSILVVRDNRWLNVQIVTGFPQTWKTWNNQGISLTGKSQGISLKVRERFEAGLSSKANHPRLLKWTYTG